MIIQDRDNWGKCQRCPLGEMACSHVLGEVVNYYGMRVIDTGNRIDLMMIGEGPGKAEDATGRPFIGPAGKLLRETIVRADLEAHALCYTNLLACRPTDVIGGPNRPPKQHEVSECEPRLKALICKLRPRVVIALGNVPKHYLSEYIHLLPEVADVMYVEAQHPAALLRQGGCNSPNYTEFLGKFQLIYEYIEGH